MRNQKGVYLAELAAALWVVLPIVILAVFVAAQVAQVYFIKQAIGACASTAARRLSIEYANDPDGAMKNATSHFNGITYLNVVNSPVQFSIPAGNAGWNLDSNPRTVSVDVTFYPGKYGCPDVITWGQWSALTARATQNLEGY